MGQLNALQADHKQILSDRANSTATVELQSQLAEAEVLIRELRVDNRQRQQQIAELTTELASVQTKLNRFEAAPAIVPPPVLVVGPSTRGITGAAAIVVRVVAATVLARWGVVIPDTDSAGAACHSASSSACSWTQYSWHHGSGSHSREGSCCHGTGEMGCSYPRHRLCWCYHS